jgi:hypothetical protein
MPVIHQCPRCDLRFESRAELEDHLSAEHPVEVDDDTLNDPGL